MLIYNFHRNDIHLAIYVRIKVKERISKSMLRTKIDYFFLDVDKNFMLQKKSLKNDKW